MNKDLLKYWIENGLAYNAKDGAWAWTDKGKKIPSMVRTILSNILYGDKPQRFMVSILKENGFDKNGQKNIDDR